MIGIKKKIMGPMAGLILLIGITACENELGFSSPQQEERQVAVSLSLGLLTKRMVIHLPGRHVAMAWRRTVLSVLNRCQWYIQELMQG